jgi:hypothetical protein
MNAGLHYISGVFSEVRTEILSVIYMNAGLHCISGVFCEVRTEILSVIYMNAFIVSAIFSVRYELKFKLLFTGMPGFIYQQCFL